MGFFTDMMRASGTRYGGAGILQQLRQGLNSPSGMQFADAAQMGFLPWENAPGIGDFRLTRGYTGGDSDNSYTTGVFTGNPSGGDSSSAAIDPEALAAYLEQQGYQIGTWEGAPEQTWRWLEDAEGNYVPGFEPQNYFTDDRAAGMLGALALGGAGLAAMGAGVGAAGGAGIGQLAGGLPAIGESLPMLEMVGQIPSVASWPETAAIGGTAGLGSAAGDVVEVVGQRLPTSTLPSSPGGPPIGPSLPPLGPAPVEPPVQLPPIVPPLPSSGTPASSAPGLPNLPSTPGTGTPSTPGAGNLPWNDLIRLIGGGLAMQQSDKYREMAKMPTLEEFQGMPGYAAAMDAVNRRQAAAGTLRSGTADAAAASMGAALYDQLYNQKLKQAAGYATGTLGLMSGLGLAGAGLGNLGTTLGGLNWGNILGGLSGGAAPPGTSGSANPNAPSGGIDWAGMGTNLGNLFDLSNLGGWGSDIFGPKNWPTGPGE